MKSLVLAFAASLVLPGAALAQSPLTPAQLFVQRYDEIPNFDGDSGSYCCANLISESGPDQDFIHVRVVFDVAFSETLERVSVNSSDITVMLPGAEEGLRPIGRFDYMPVFEYGSSSISARRPRDWPAETEQAFIDAVWLVPNGVLSGTLVVGEEGSQMQLPLNFNVPPGQVMTPAQTVQVTVRGFTAEPTLSVSDRSNRQDIAGRIVPMGAQALRLDLSLTPTMSTSTDAQQGENRFFMLSSHIGLVGPNGLPLTPLGYATNDSLNLRWSISSNWDDAPRTSEFALYFLGNPDPGIYSVYYLSDVVARFDLQ